MTPLNNPLVQQYTWSMPTKDFNPSPTFRVDYELSQSHRLTGSFNYRHINSTPDTTNNAQLPFPSSADHRQPAVHAVDDVGVAALDVWRRTS